MSARIWYEICNFQIVVPYHDEMKEEQPSKERFKEHLYEATLLAFGKILSKYNAFAQDLLLKETGKEILEYLRRQGYTFSETNSSEDLFSAIDMFVRNGFVETLEVEQAERGQKFTWHNLYGFQAYKELQEYSENPFLACPLNAVLWYLAAGQGKTLRILAMTFIDENRTAVCIKEIVPIGDDVESAEKNGFEPTVLKNTQLLELAEERARKLEQILNELKILRGLLPICAHCKKIRDDRGYWKQLEQYLEEHSEAKFSHCLCPDCFEEKYPEIAALADGES